MTVQLFAIDVNDQQDKLVGYINAKANVARYVEALQNTDISGVNFKTLPPDIQKQLPQDPATLLKTVNTNLTIAKQHGLTWSNDIQPGLTAIPQAIINYNTQFQTEADDILSGIQALIRNPHDAVQRANLILLFKGLLDKLGEQTTALGDEMAALRLFNTNVTTDYGNFSSGNTDFKAIRDFESTQLKNLNDAITLLNGEIATLNKAITVEAVALAASAALIAGGVIGLANAETGVGLVVGAVCIVVGMAGLGVAAGELINSISDKQTAVQNEAFDQLEVNELTVQVQALNTTETALSALVTQSALTMQSVQVILDTWATLQGKLQAVIGDLHDSEKDMGDILSKEDIEDAQTQWGQLQTFADSMQEFEEKTFANPPVTLPLQPMEVKAVA